MLVELAEAYTRTDITMPEYLAARKPIEQRIADEENCIVADAEIRARASRHDLRERWPELSVEERREAIRTVVDHIVVNRSGRTRVFYPSRIEVVWTSLTIEQGAAETDAW
jgi:site-specific DNA recombinase